MRSEKPMLARVAVLAFLVLAAAPLAQATTQYSFGPGSMFLDGGSITGTFEFSADLTDPMSPVYSFELPFSITTGTGTFGGGGALYAAGKPMGNTCISTSVPGQPLNCVLTGRSLSVILTFVFPDGDLLLTANELVSVPGEPMPRSRQTDADGIRVSSSGPAVVPEPGSVVLMLTGIAGIGLWRSRRRGPQ